MQDVIKIGVVGAGETGTPLLAQLIEARLSSWSVSLTLTSPSQASP